MFNQCKLGIKWVSSFLLYQLSCCVVAAIIKFSLQAFVELVIAYFVHNFAIISHALHVYSADTLVVLETWNGSMMDLKFNSYYVYEDFLILLWFGIFFWFIFLNFQINSF